jgi:succinate-acetate transporter protein
MQVTGTDLRGRYVMATERELTTESARRAAGGPGGPQDPTAGRTASAAEWASESARSIADPGPLGLSAFALTTFLLSLVNAKVIPAGAEPIVFGLALAYGGIGQFAAGMWEFRKGNTFGATAFSSFGAFWISYWALVTFYVKALGPAAGSAVGWYLVAWGIFTTLMLLASVRTTAGVALVFLLLAITFYLLGFGAWTTHTWVTTTGGWFGIATAGAAWYAALASVTASTFGRHVLPNPSLARPALR